MYFNAWGMYMYTVLWVQTSTMYTIYYHYTLHMHDLLHETNMINGNFHGAERVQKKDFPAVH